VDVHYADVEKIVLVLDNLNILRVRFMRLLNLLELEDLRKNFKYIIHRDMAVG
jgi:hypothetical protein